MSWARLLLLVIVVSLTVNSPAVNSGEGQAGVASWYGERYRGRPTASGEIYNPDQLTAAHRSLPFGTLVRCTYQNKSVVVRITDRGPFVKGRVIDLSKAAFAKLAPTSRGLIKIKIEIVRKRNEKNNKR